MKILVLTNKAPYPPKDGGAIAVFNLSKGLAELGHSVHILAYNTRKHKVATEEIPSFKNLEFTHIDIDTSINPAKAFFNLLFSRKPYNAQRFITKKYTDELARILKKETFDIVQLEGPYMWFCVPVIRSNSKARIALRGHNIEHEIWQRTASFESNYLKKFYLKELSKRIKKFEQSIINQYDILLPITARDERIFQTMGNSKPSHVVPVGINSLELCSKSNENLTSLFYIGALDWIPNQEGLIWFIEQVWPLILKKNPLTILHIAGRNAPKWFSDKISVRNVLYHGEIEDAYSYMEQAGIMIVPLLSGSGMRVKIIEGMALGKAIVSTSIGVEGIEVTHDENVMIANDPENFAGFVSKLLDSRELIKKISINARNCAREKYDNTVIASSLSNFYTTQKQKL